jgi:hypothetical protein
LATPQAIRGPALPAGSLVSSSASPVHHDRRAIGVEQRGRADPEGDRIGEIFERQRPVGADVDVRQIAA